MVSKTDAATAQFRGRQAFAGLARSRGGRDSNLFLSTKSEDSSNVKLCLHTTGLATCGRNMEGGFGRFIVRVSCVGSVRCTQSFVQPIARAEGSGPCLSQGS